MPQVLKWLNLEAEQSGIPARGMFVNYFVNEQSYNLS